jgi:hypothetical protein
MPRPKKIDTTPAKEVAKDEGLVTLKHFAKGGTMFIDGIGYPIKDGYVKVKPEHYAQAQEHIKLGG